MKKYFMGIFVTILSSSYAHAGWTATTSMDWKTTHPDDTRCVDLSGNSIVDTGLYYKKKFIMLLPSGEPLKFTSYKITSDHGEFIGDTDDKGETLEVCTEVPTKLKLDLHWMTLEKLSDEENGMDMWQNVKNKEPK